MPPATSRRKRRTQIAAGAVYPQRTSAVSHGAADERKARRVVHAPQHAHQHESYPQHHRVRREGGKQRRSPSAPNRDRNCALRAEVVSGRSGRQRSERVRQRCRRAQYAKRRNGHAELQRDDEEHGAVDKLHGVVEPVRNAREGNDAAFSGHHTIGGHS